MNKIIISLIALVVVISPVMALAQIGGTPPTISLDLTALGNKIASTMWIVFTILAVIMFVVAGIQFLTAQGDPEKVQAARGSLIWGVVGVVVAILAFTIITIVKSAIG